MPDNAVSEKIEDEYIKGTEYQQTCCSLGIKAMLISFNVLIYLASRLRDNSSNNASGQAVRWIANKWLKQTI